MVKQGAASVLGIDPSAKMLEIAKQQHHHPSIEFKQIPAETLQTPDQSLDLVISSKA